MIMFVPMILEFNDKKKSKKIPKKKMIFCYKFTEIRWHFYDHNILHMW